MGNASKKNKAKAFGSPSSFIEVEGKDGKKYVVKSKISKVEIQRIRTIEAYKRYKGIS